MSKRHVATRSCRPLVRHSDLVPSITESHWKDGFGAGMRRDMTELAASWPVLLVTCAQCFFPPYLVVKRSPELAGLPSRFWLQKQGGLHALLVCYSWHRLVNRDCVSGRPSCSAVHFTGPNPWSATYFSYETLGKSY